MIGDYFSRMAAAQKLSPEQLPKEVQDGILTPNMAKDAAASQPNPQGINALQEPPIGQQIMQDASKAVGPEELAQKIEVLKNNINQIQQGVQSGQLEAYKGIPLIKEQMDMLRGLESQLQAMTQPQQGIDVAQSNLPVQMAGGGIVAFADGDLVDEDSDAEKEDQALFSHLLGGISMPKSYESMLAEKGYTPQSLRDLVRKTRKDDLGNYVAPAEGSAAAPVVGRKLNMQGHPYHDEVVKYSKQIGLDPEIGLKVLYTETGGMKDPAHARSKAGAVGPMQLMGPTAKEVHVNRFDPIQNVHGGLDYLKQQVDTFGDPKLAAAAYNAGPTNVRRALNSGAGISALPMETRQYAANFANGGVVALSSGGDFSVNHLLNAEYGYPNETERALAEEYGPKTKAPSAAPKVARAPSREAAEFLEQQAARKAPTSVASAAAEAPGMISRLNKLIGGYAAPAAVYEGGKALGSATMGTMAGNPYFEGYSDPFMGDVAVGNAILNQNQGALNLARQPEPTTTPAAPAKPATPAAPTQPQFTKAPVPMTGPTDEELGRLTSTTPPEPSDGGLADLHQMIKDQMAEAKKQKEIGGWLSLLSAGVGGLQAAGNIRPGVVHTALGDLATGAQQGISQYAQTAKQYADEMKTNLTARLGLSRAELYEKMRQDALKERVNQNIASNALASQRIGLAQKTLDMRQNAAVSKAQSDLNKEGEFDNLKSKYATQYGKKWENDTNHMIEFNKEKQALIKQRAGGYTDAELGVPTYASLMQQ
jgi:hypothetical protein